MQVSEPVRLFEAFVDHFIDGEYSLANVQLALASIDRDLRSRASSITAFGFAPLEIDAPHDEHDIIDHNDHNAEFQFLYDQCTDEQRNAVDAV